MIREFDTDRSDAATGATVGTDVRTEFRPTDRITTTDRVSATASENRSITDLLKDLRDESSRLVRQEVALAKTELSEKAAKLGRNAGYMGAGSGLAHAALIESLARSPPKVCGRIGYSTRLRLPHRSRLRWRFRPLSLP